MLCEAAGGRRYRFGEEEEGDKSDDNKLLADTVSLRFRGSYTDRVSFPADV